MATEENGSGEERIVLDVNRAQLQHFTDSDPRCRALQLPEGIMLRYTLTHALYFYLRTGARDGRIVTRVFASDSPYDRQRTSIGEVSTGMFEARAEVNHLEKVRGLLHSWVDFVKEDADNGVDFKSFPLDERPE